MKYIKLIIYQRGGIYSPNFKPELIPMYENMIKTDTTLKSLLEALY